MNHNFSNVGIFCQSTVKQTVFLKVMYNNHNASIKKSAGHNSSTTKLTVGMHH